MRAIDDDGDGTANGTPHAGAIFSALADHNIACGAAGDPTNQNQTSCPTLGAPTVTGEGQNNTAILTWTAVANATRYAIYPQRHRLRRRPDQDRDRHRADHHLHRHHRRQRHRLLLHGAGAGSHRRLLRAGLQLRDRDAGALLLPGRPDGLTAAAAGANQISLSWTSSDPGADSFNVYRAVGACPQPAYQLVASGLATTSYLDTTVSGGLDYSYVVTAKDITGGCESATSNCAQAQTTGSCVEPPGFAGLSR